MLDSIEREYTFISIIAPNRIATFFACAEFSAFTQFVLSQEKRELRSGYHRFSANENRTYSTSGRMHETSVVFEQNQFYLKSFSAVSVPIIAWVQSCNLVSGTDKFSQRVLQIHPLMLPAKQTISDFLVSDCKQTASRIRDQTSDKSTPEASMLSR
ncbi:unnamed protein product [Albugo candida]|uniref:Uncharacterized protein n=1 Tax=Albugo candida TaxID=65357 RepID=A0A024GAI0_9STRA|nr:unnamed protein product [Albugo candida]|eukprot:CCI43674.1 unnamed protein product [Albugo candida]